MSKILLCSLFLFFICGIGYTQSRVINGQVTGKDDAQPIPGVNIIIQGTNKGTSTDVNGKYSIEIDPGQNTLVFTFIGYKPQLVEVGQREVVDVILETDATNL